MDTEGGFLLRDITVRLIRAQFAHARPLDRAGAAAGCIRRRDQPRLSVGERCLRVSIGRAYLRRVVPEGASR